MRQVQANSTDLYLCIRTYICLLAYVEGIAKKNKHSTGNCGRYIVMTRGILIFEFSLRPRENGGKNAFSMLNRSVLLSNCVLPFRMCICTYVYMSIFNLTTIEENLFNNLYEYIWNMKSDSRKERKIFTNVCVTMM